METSLHQQLKAHYAGDDGEVEVRLGRYRIDVVRDDRLIEIQHGGLAAIRDKVRSLCKQHRVLVVKPIVATKTLIKCKQKGGRVVSRRRSPKRGELLDLFDELVHFTRAFPHRNLTLEAALVEVEEWRYPGHGKRRRWRKNDFVVEDQKLVDVVRVHRLQSRQDLLGLLPADLPQPFNTAQLAEGLGKPRWVAQRIAYCLREMGAAKPVGKQGNAILYKTIRRQPASAASRKRAG